LLCTRLFDLDLVLLFLAAGARVLVDDGLPRLDLLDLVGTIHCIVPLLVAREADDLPLVALLIDTSALGGLLLVTTPLSVRLLPPVGTFFGEVSVATTLEALNRILLATIVSLEHEHLYLTSNFIVRLPDRLDLGHCGIKVLELPLPRFVFELLVKSIDELGQQ